MENLLKPHSCVLPVECLQQGQGQWGKDERVCFSNSFAGDPSAGGQETTLGATLN